MTDEGYGLGLVFVKAWAVRDKLSKDAKSRLSPSPVILAFPGPSSSARRLR